MSPHPAAPPRQNAPNHPPWLKTSADCTLDALVIAAAVVIAAQRPARAASRMALLVCARRAGLLATPPRRDLLAELDHHLAAFRHSPTERRRRLVNGMNPLVGSSAARIVVRAAEEIAGPAEAAVLRELTSALGLLGPPPA